MEKSKDLIFKAAPFGAASFYLFSNKCVLTESAYGANPVIGNILSLSGFTCLQQSAMNFGILMIQGLVNSFGSATMAAFAVAVKIDTIAYMLVQDFGNAFSVFTAQNYGAGKYERIRKGIKQSLISVVLFCFAVSTAVFFLSQPLMSPVLLGQRNYSNWCTVSENRGAVLCRHRNTVYALRLLQSGK